MPIDTDAGSDAVAFLGVRFSKLSFDAVVDHIEARPAEADFGYIVTPNVDHIVRLDSAKDSDLRERFRQAYDGAYLRLCDSRILARLAAWRSVKLTVVTGSDLTAHLFEKTLRTGDRVAIVGGRQDTVARLADAYQGPVYLQHIPPMGVLENREALSAAADFIAQAQSRLTFIAIGAPQGEILAHMVSSRGAATGFGLCIGASIDFVTGHQQRAPHWMRRTGLEWAHRLGTQPRRLWRRYLVEAPRIFWLVAKWKDG